MAVLTGVTTSERPTDDGGRCSLLPDHLNADLPPAWPVELREDDRLEPAQRELGVVDPDGDGPPEQCGPEVRVRVAALAVRHARVVVAVADSRRHEPLVQPPPGVGEGAVELGDEKRAGGGER